ncbi:MAG: SDR family oxidoreductase [Halieaceae bacterium]|nr:SDR family oxidoreductase [Halieaceae bacterium]
MNQRFLNRVANVTGAGQGIGKGVALRLAQEGAKVIIAEFNAATGQAAAAEIESIGGKAMPYQIDVSDPSAARRMVEDIAKAWGQIDILVNNAGVVSTRPMMEVSEAQWDRTIDVNQKGVFFMIQAVAAQMIRQLPGSLRNVGVADVVAEEMSGGSGPSEEELVGLAGSYGKIVNFSSISGRRGRPLAADYAASKAAVISITQSAALALAPYRINVNAICPGIVVTPMWEQIDKDRARLFGAPQGQAVTAFINQVPLKRAATEEDIAGAVAFLCSSDADYITGQALNVDGGFEMD